MSLHSVGDVSDAFAATRAFARGLDAPQWLRLAIIAILTGGVSAPTTSYQYDASQVTPGGMPNGFPGSTVGGQLGAIILLAVVLAILLAFLLAILGSIL